MTKPIRSRAPRRLARKKPTEVTCLQFLGDNWEDVASFVGPENIAQGPGLDETINLRLWVATSRAWCDVAPGSWIIEEPDHQGFYPCTRSDFARGYELIEGTPLAESFTEGFKESRQ